MNIFKPGIEVGIRRDLVGRVLRVTIGPQCSVEYEIGWWDGLEFKKAWFGAEMIVVVQDMPTAIGFK